ncbi:MAG: hypothetical protein E6J90_06470 [Deltaproteobacteria bacterium]|nr:MAG: hypothetical protein E6J91_03110 [Deltaproteobacteria bacterium]TMQ25169.1 MAG: hypothetical protein E6J90_06470 [Deltaproteobacteria bacterium]
MSTKTKLRIKVRDRVRFRLGVHLWTGTVVEDLGKIGVGGEQLVRVQVPLESTEPQVFELSAALLTPAPRRRAAA